MKIEYVGDDNFSVRLGDDSDHYDRVILSDFVNKLERSNGAKSLTLKSSSYTSGATIAFLFGLTDRPRILRTTDRLGYFILRIQRRFF